MALVAPHQTPTIGRPGWRPERAGGITIDHLVQVPGNETTTMLDAVDVGVGVAFAHGSAIGSYQSAGFVAQDVTVCVTTDDRPGVVPHQTPREACSSGARELNP